MSPVRTAATGAPNRALIVTGSLGMGHHVMSAAVSSSLAQRGWETRTEDAMSMLGGVASGAADRVFRQILSNKPLYDAIHFSSFRTGGRLARGMDRAATTKLMPVVRRLVADYDPSLVLSVFATSAGAVSRLKRSRPDLVSVVFCTDATAHCFWVHDRTDLFLVTSEVAACSVRRFQPDATIAVVPAPVRPQFYDPPTQEDARERLGVPPDARCVLVMAGGWGLGPLAEVATALAAAGVHVLAVAGHNRRLAARLHQIAATEPRVHPFGFTDRVPELMAAADLVATTPGDTCTEARVIGRDLLLLDVVPGHGRDNLQHELEMGAAQVTTARPDLFVRTALAALDRVKPPTARVIGTPDAWERALADAFELIGIELARDV